MPEEGAGITPAQVVSGMMAVDAFSRWLGVSVDEIGPGFARISMTIREEMLNGFGVCHGGVTFAFADSAFAFASNSHGKVAMSIEGAMSYPTSVQLGDRLEAVAEELAAAGPIANYQVRVRNQKQETVALFRGTVYRTKRDHQPTRPAAKA